MKTLKSARSIPAPQSALALVAAGLLLAPAALQAQPASAPAMAAKQFPTPADGYFETIERVAGGVWLIRQPGFQVQPVGNVTVIEQSDGLVMIDSGGSPGSARRILRLIRSVSRKPVKAIVITHWHGDHNQGLATILLSWPRARTIAHSATTTHLATPKTMASAGAPDPVRNSKYLEQVRGFQTYIQGEAAKAAPGPIRSGWETALRLMNQYELDMDGALTIAPKESFTDRLLIDDRQRPVELRFLGRANTDGDSIAWLPRQRILISGDIVVAPSPYGFNSFPGEWIETLRKLKAIGFATLLPGHGAPQRDHGYLDRLIALLGDTRTQVGALAAQGLSLEEVGRKVDLSRHIAGFVGDDPWKRRWFDQYWTAPIVASAYKEAKGETIVQALGG